MRRKSFEDDEKNETKNLEQENLGQEEVKEVKEEEEENDAFA